MAYKITERCDGCGACVKWCPVAAIRGEKKALHSVDGGLCIDCGACGRICPRGSVEDAFGIPAVMRRRSLWEKPQIDAETCMLCGICIDACPAGCLGRIDIVGDIQREKVGVTDDKACLGCGFCRRECPVSAVAMTGPSA